MFYFFLRAELADAHLTAHCSQHAKIDGLAQAYAGTCAATCRDTPYVRHHARPPPRCSQRMTPCPRQVIVLAPNPAHSMSARATHFIFWFLPPDNATLPRCCFARLLPHSRASNTPWLLRNPHAGASLDRPATVDHQSTTSVLQTKGNRVTPQLVDAINQG
jgi:hypothetical protein